jgi:hypothetical protein
VISTRTNVRDLRSGADLTQTQAAEMVHLPGGRAAWMDIERGRARLDAARWELFKIKTGNHVLYKAVAGHHIPTREDTSPGMLLAHYAEECRRLREERSK